MSPKIWEVFSYYFFKNLSAPFSLFSPSGALMIWMFICLISYHNSGRCSLLFYYFWLLLFLYWIIGNKQYSGSLTVASAWLILLLKSFIKFLFLLLFSSTLQFLFSSFWWLHFLYSSILLLQFFQFPLVIYLCSLTFLHRGSLRWLF